MTARRNSTCSAPQPRVGGYGRTVSTASMAWAVVNLLTTSQHSTRVGAFTHSQNMCKVPSAQTLHVRRDIELRCPSFLNYRNIESQPTLKGRFQQCHVEVFKITNTTNASWKNFLGGQIHNEINSSSGMDQQLIIDNYLESIHRRYSRVHRTETKDDRSQQSFTRSLVWRTIKESSRIKEVKQRKQEDALFILGLAELASARLLQKHRLPVIQSQRQLDTPATHYIRVSLVAKYVAQIINSMHKSCKYCVVVALYPMTWLYYTLRRRASIFAQFLTVLSFMSRWIARDEFTSELAIKICVSLERVQRELKYW